MSQSIIPEFALLLGLGDTHAHPTQQLQSFPAAAALVMTRACAGFALLVAGLTISHFLVTIESRATFLHTTATQEKEALFTPVTPILVTAATITVTCLAFQFLTVGLLRTGFITMLIKPVIPHSARCARSWIIQAASQTSFFTRDTFFIVWVLDFTLSTLQLLARVVGGR